MRDALHVASAAEQEAEADFIVLADTEGNRFCIVDPGHRPAGG